jgi:hypothetical protein
MAGLARLEKLGQALRQLWRLAVVARDTRGSHEQLHVAKGRITVNQVDSLETDFQLALLNHPRVGRPPSVKSLLIDTGLYKVKAAPRYVVPRVVVARLYTRRLKEMVAPAWRLLRKRAVPP